MIGVIKGDTRSLDYTIAHVDAALYPPDFVFDYVKSRSPHFRYSCGLFLSPEP